MRAEARIAHWLGVVSDLIGQPTADFPIEQIAAELHLTFEVNVVTWQWQDGAGCYGFEAFPMPTGLDDEWWQAESDPTTFSEHPLVLWHACTGDTRPYTTGRVPAQLTTARGVQLSRSLLEPLGCEEQLTLLYRLGPFHHRGFVLSRDGRDFDDEDLTVATSLQRAFLALDRQHQLFEQLSAWRPGDESGDPVSEQLTAREVNVLSLLAGGHTAYGIARRLGISPRTVQKHLEHVYRKLGVRDRLGAIRTAETLRLAIHRDSAIPSRARGRDRGPDV